MNRKRLFTVLCLLVCIAMCTLTGCKKGEQYHEDCGDTTITTQATVSNTVSGYYNAAGNRYYDPNSADSKVLFETLLHDIESAGTGITFDYDSVRPSEAGYYVSLNTPLDGWGHGMLLYIESESSTNKLFHITVLSAGADNEFNSGGILTPKSESGSDDVRWHFSAERPR